MKACAKMYRVYKEDGKDVLRLVEPIMNPSAIAEVLEGEKVRVELWHGTCLDSEVSVVVAGGRAVVTLTPRKTLGPTPPAEALL